MTIRPIDTTTYKMSTGQKITRFLFRGNYKRADILKKAQAMSRTAVRNGHDGQMAVALHYDTIGQSFGGQYKDFGEPIYLFKLDDYDRWKVYKEPETYPAFAIYVKSSAPRAGGAGKSNDCLFQCLTQALLRMPWKTDKALKSYLKLKADDPIDIIKLIPKIEEKLDEYKVKIHVLGDHQYISTKKHAATVFLRLEQGHYTIDKTQTIPIRGISHKEKKIITYEPETMMAYDGERLFTATKQELKESQDNSQIKKGKPMSKYIFVTENDYYDDNRKIVTEMIKKDIIKEGDTVTAKEILIYKHEKLIAEFQALKSATDGEINLFKTGKKHVAVLDLFTKCHSTSHPEPIVEDEAAWLQEASTGAIIYGKRGTHKNVHAYDFRSVTHRS